jgi:hypothetical protein
MWRKCGANVAQMWRKCGAYVAHIFFLQTIFIHGKIISK